MQKHYQLTTYLVGHSHKDEKRKCFTELRINLKHSYCQELN